MSDAQTPTDRPIRKWGRSYLYGRSRMNDWPLWLSWLLAPSRSSRQIVRELMQLRKSGVDV
jgi:hypothetical protein